MKFEELIKSISEDFTAAWNNWEIEKLMSFVSNNIVIHSPQIKLVYPDLQTCELEGKDALQDYWLKLKDMMKNFKVEQINLTKEGREIKTVNKVIGEDIIIVETIILDEYGKIIFLDYQYN